jgi:TRAP-type C4-dicarboxylate transport system substrate-binding protein
MIISRVLKFMRTTNLLRQNLVRAGVFVVLAVGSLSSHAVTFKIATLSPEGTGWMKALRGAAKNISERTDGAV